MGVTGVLNAAQGSMSGWSYVNTKASFYSRCNIRFLGVPALDVKHYPINQHFEEAVNFIESVLINKGMNSLIFINKSQIKYYYYGNLTKSSIFVIILFCLFQE